MEGKNKVLTQLLLIASLVFSGLHAQAATRSPFIVHTISSQKITMKYAVYLPPHFSWKSNWPVIMSLHGTGEMGTDGMKQTTTGLAPAVLRNPERFPAIVIFPQSPGINFASGDPITDDLENLIMQILDQVIEKYNGDVHRVILTGFSQGGGGVWRYGAHHPGHFAAIVPIAGFGYVPWIVPPLRTMPIWAFHGSADSAVNAQCSRDLVKGVRDEGNRKTRYTEYPGANHNVWDMTYANPDVINWMLMQSK